MSARAEAGRGLYTPVLGALATLVGLLVVTTLVVTTGHLSGLDEAGLDAFASVPQTGLVHGLVVAVTATASAPVGIVLLALLGLGVGLHRHRLAPLLLTSAAAVVLVVCVYGLKAAVGRARPGLAAVTDPEPGFPSGHTTTAVVVAGTALVLLGSALSPTWRRLAIVLLVAYVSAVGLSRLYLQMHWFSDVLAGWLLGSAIVCGVAIASVRSRPSDPVEPRVAAGSTAGGVS